MNYYPFHIGDYFAHTAHLSPLEDIAYRRCMDFYYLHEKPLPMDLAEVARLIRMREHADLVAAVVREFFAQGVDGWYSDRATREIESYQRMAQGAKRGAAKRWGKPDDAHPMPTACPPQTEGNANQNKEPEPRTNNQEPNKKTKGAVAPEFVLPDWISAEAWAGYIDMRKRIKKPMTKRAMELAVGKLAELMRSGHDPKVVLDQSTMNSWQGLFEIKGGAVASRSRSTEPAWREEQRSRVAQAVPSIAARPIQQPRTIEMEATHVAPPALGR